MNQTVDFQKQPLDGGHPKPYKPYTSGIQQLRLVTRCAAREFGVLRVCLLGGVLEMEIIALRIGP